MPNSLFESITREIERKVFMPAPISGVYVKELV